MIPRQPPHGASRDAAIIKELEKALPTRLSELDPEQLVAAAKQVARALATTVSARDIGNTQVRAIYDEFVRVRTIMQTGSGESLAERLHLMRPRLAYAASRIQRGKEVFRAFVELLDAAIVKALASGPEEPRLRRGIENLLNLTEAIVSYLSFERAGERQ